MRNSLLRRTGGAALALMAVVTAGCQIQTPPPGAPAPSTTPSTTPSGTAVPPTPGAPTSSTSPTPSTTEPPTTTPPVTTPLPADARFVAPGGNDAGPGTAERPWATVAHAVRAAPAGGTVALRAGVYREGDLRVRQHLTVRSVPGERAELRGSVVVDGWVRDGDDWCKTGWTAAFPPGEREGPEYLAEGFPMASHHDQVFVNGTPLAQVAGRGQVAEGGFHVDYGGDRLCIGTDPTGRTVEATAFANGIEMWQADGDGAGRSRVEGLTVSHYAESGLTVGRPGTVVQGNEVRRNGVAGLKVTDAADVVVRDNVLELNGRLGIRSSRSDRLLLEGNRVLGNNTESFAIQWDAAGGKFTEGEDQVFRDNVFEGNRSTGLWLDIGNDRATIVDNLARSNRAIGIFFEISAEALIVSNVSHSNGMGIMVSNSTDAQVVNNTLWDNNTNLVVKDSGRVAERPGEEIATFETRRTVVVNNVLSDARGGQQIDTEQYRHRSCGPGRPSMFSTVDHNGYHRTTAGKPANAVAWVEQPPGCDAEYATVEQFRAATSHEDHGVGLDGTGAFVDPAAGDFRLRPDSPFNDAGAPLSAAAADAVGVPQGRPVDLGALTLSAP